MSARSLALLPPFLLFCLLALQCTHQSQRIGTRSAAAEARTSFPSDFERRVKRHGFVNIREYAPSIPVDLHYATSNNVAGQPIYPRNMPCLLRQKTADKLLRAQRELQAQGLGLKIWDAWRPARSHLALWDAAPKSGYVVPPSAGFSRHCLGVAVDVTLVDSRGRELPMPTRFDDFTPAAASKYSGNDEQIRNRVAALQRAMRNAGFSGINSEWWHFSDLSTPADVVFANELGIQLPNNVRKVKFTYGRS
ncbi:MAG: M15 family metallopeptidase [Verrucomicrobiota bacterium]